MKKIVLGIFVFCATLSLQAQSKKIDKLMAKDWPNLKRYREANNKIVKTKQYPIAVFMGNSITDNWYQKDPQFFQKNKYAGRGISGQTTPQMLIRFTPDVIDLKAKVVVILAGTNDIAGNTGFASVKMITDNLKAMAQLAKANNIKVIFCSILPVKEYPWRKQIKNPTEKIKKVNAWMKEYSQKKGIYYLDYYVGMALQHGGMKPGISIDGVHPNEKGYNIMEPLVVAKIESVLNK